MRYLMISALVAFAGLAAACGASPEAQCHDSIHITCDKIHECTAEADKAEDLDADGTPDFEEFFGANVGECETIFDDGKTVDMGGTTFEVGGAMCENVTEDNACEDDPSGSTYDSKAAKDCQDALEALTCEQWNDPAGETPAACNDVCS